MFRTFNSHSESAEHLRLGPGKAGILRINLRTTPVLQQVELGMRGPAATVAFESALAHQGQGRPVRFRDLTLHWGGWKMVTAEAEWSPGRLIFHTKARKPVSPSVVRRLETTAVGSLSMPSNRNCTGHPPTISLLKPSSQPATNPCNPLFALSPQFPCSPPPGSLHRAGAG